MSMDAVAERPVRPPALALGDELDFLRLVWAVVHGLERASKHMEHTLGLTGPQRLVLRIVGRFPGITLARLAAVLQVHPSTASGIVKRLEARGLLSRDTDPRDRRRAYLGLTAAGRALDIDSAGTIEGAVHRLLATAPPAAVESTRWTLIRLAAELERLVAGDGKPRGRPRRRA